MSSNPLPPVETEERAILLRLIRAYVIIAGAAYAFSIAIALSSARYRVDLVVLGAFVSLSFGFILYLAVSEPRFRSATGVASLTFAYSTPLGLLYLGYFLSQSGTLFPPNAVDTIFYHETALELRDSTLADAVRAFLIENEIDDLGAMLYALLLYKLLPTPLAVYFANILLGVASAGLMYGLLRRRVSSQMATFFALLFSTASFAVFLRVSHFKEPLLIFLVLLAFRRLESLGRTATPKKLLELLAVGAVVYLFRPVLALFILGAFGVWVLFTYRSSGQLRAALLVAGLGALLFLSPQLESYVRRSFLLDPERMFRVSQAAEAGYGSITLSFLASFFSALFGPIPSILAVDGREVSAFYGPGLLFRYLLAIPALLGAVHVLKTRQRELYPLLTFLLLEAFALAAILRGFDLRFALPHVPLLYLFAALQFSRTTPRVNSRSLVIAAGAMLLVIALWFNLRVEIVELRFGA